MASSVTLLIELARIEPGHEDDAGRHPGCARASRCGCGSRRAGKSAGISAPWFNPRLRASSAFMKHARAGKRFVELRHAHGHRARMPMLENPAGDEPEVVFLVRQLGRQLVRNGDDPRPAVRIAVEFDTLCLASHRDRIPPGNARASPCRRRRASAGRAPHDKCRKARGRDHGRVRRMHTPRTIPSEHRSRTPFASALS